MANINDIRYTDYSPVTMPAEIAHSNSNNYAIVDGSNVGGVARVNLLGDLYYIPDDILRQEGYVVYCVEDKQKYKLIDWNNRGNTQGWVRIFDIEQTLGTTDPPELPDEYQLPIAKMVGDTEFPGGKIGGVIPDGESIGIDPVTGVISASAAAIAKIYKDYDITQYYVNKNSVIDITQFAQVAAASVSLFYAGQRLVRGDDNVLGQLDVNYWLTVVPAPNFYVGLNLQPMDAELTFDSNRRLILVVGDDPQYTIGMATKTSAGIVQIGNGIDVTNGVISVINSGGGESISQVPKWVYQGANKGAIDGINYAYELNNTVDIVSGNPATDIALGDIILCQNESRIEVSVLPNPEGNYQAKTVHVTANIDTSDFVTVSTSQTIGGSKNFTGNTTMNSLSGLSSSTYATENPVILGPSNIAITGSATISGNSNVGGKFVVASTTNKIPANLINAWKMSQNVSEPDIIQESLEPQNAGVLIIYAE